ncbi:MAG: hypothetical protein RLZZ362_1222 [Actinomycetota bacterium]|jgi:glucose-6-phosphate isomerase
MPTTDQFDHGLDLHIETEPLGFSYGENCFGPPVELRRLDDIRASLRDPASDGPDVVYAIAMHVGEPGRRRQIEERHLCFGVVTYAAGRLGSEPIRSQGHVHRRSPRTGISTPEVYEIWSGVGLILMQEFDLDDPGRCFVIEAGPGDVVVVPPGWAHATISGDPAQPLTFGAWCDQDYGFEYDNVRARKGLAWYPTLDGDSVVFEPNSRYRTSELVRRPARVYPDLGIATDRSIWTQFCRAPDRFDFVHDPSMLDVDWARFEP